MTYDNKPNLYSIIMKPKYLLYKMKKRKVLRKDIMKIEYQIPREKFEPEPGFEPLISTCLA